ncbi:MAG: GNAT family N-acetyltransferase [Clostridiales Family XIII bacterium]|nr:GNAT family N-acetyltransferase [Clostridiales Family XIII bacterium]
MNIIYRIADYQNTKELRKIAALYLKVFNIDIIENLKFWFSNSPFGKPFGIVALYKEEIIGHFGTAKLNANIGGEVLDGRISMGFMVDSDYRGQGIAGNLSKQLFDRLRKQGKDNFVIGFANDVSYKMHVESMGYELIRNYTFVKLLKGENIKYEYNIVDKFKSAERKISENTIDHNDEWLNWRYGNPKYKKYISDNGNYFVITKFRNKIDVLYWSEIAKKDELLDFVNFIYKTEEIALVSSWNTFDYLNEFKKEDRNYHFTMNILAKEKEELLKSDWFFYMGDCELF